MIEYINMSDGAKTPAGSEKEASQLDTKDQVLIDIFVLVHYKE